MSAAPSEPEKYSIDEMMDRLKGSPSGSPEDGELVTRADGSQVIRVRKRKRRSSQPHKEDAHRTRRARIMQVSAALVLVFVAALAGGGAIAYANSRPFRDGLVRKIEEASGATTDLQKFRMNPQTANAGNLTLTWPEGNVLKSLWLRGFVAKISPASFLGKSMTGEEVTFPYGELALQIPKAGEPLRNHPAPEGASAIDFERYRAPILDITLGNPTAPVIKLTKTEGSFSAETVRGRPRLTLYRGDLAIGGWPKLRMDRALIEFTDREAKISSLQLLHETDDSGTFLLSGTVAPYKPGQRSTMAVELGTFQLSGLIGPAFGGLFSGRIDSLPSTTSNQLSFLPTESPAPKLDLTFRVSTESKIEVRRFPFLFALSQTLDEDPWFEHPVFEGDAGGVLHRDAGVVSLRNLDLASKGRLALRGEISMTANQALSGNLKVGLPEAMISGAPTSRLKSMFGPLKDGFRWLTLEIGGSATAPTDNFKELFSAAPVKPRQPAVPEDYKESSFEELTRPR